MLASGFLAMVPCANAAELTVDLSHYEYEETNEDGAFFISDTSKPVFFSAGVRDWDRPEEDGKFGLMYTGELTYGEVKYESASSGTMEKSYYKARGEGYVAYRFNKFLSPYVGLGYRHLLDNSGGRTTSVGDFYYDRLSQYLYLPIGARLDPFENFNIKAQFNKFLIGKQTSYLGKEVVGYSDAKNHQHRGMGFDVTGNYQIADKWSVYGFYRYWDIVKSNVETGYVPVLGRIVNWWEPDNTTEEFGLGVAFRF